MPHIEGDIFIKRSVEDVFDFVADERNEPRYNPRMLRVKKITTGPIGLGTRFHGETRTRRKTTEMTIEWTAYERPNRLGSSTHLATMEIDGTLTFDAVPDGTHMRWSWELQTRGFLKLMAPIFVRIGRRQERTVWTNLRELLEEQPVLG